MLEEIAVSTEKAEARQKEAQEAEEKIKSTGQIAEEKAEAEAGREALRARGGCAGLNDLKKDDITELRSFAKPHPLVQDVCACVVLLKGLKDTSWKGAKR